MKVFETQSTQIRIPNTIYVSGLHPNVTKDILEELFINAGPIERVTLPLNRTTGASRTYAFVLFKDDESVAYAIQLFKGVCLYGAKVILEEAYKFQPRALAIPRPKPPEGVSTALKDTSEDLIEIKDDISKGAIEHPHQEPRSREDPQTIPRLGPPELASLQPNLGISSYGPCMNPLAKYLPPHSPARKFEPSRDWSNQGYYDSIDHGRFARDLSPHELCWEGIQSGGMPYNPYPLIALGASYEYSNISGKKDILPPMDFSSPPPPIVVQSNQSNQRGGPSRRVITDLEHPDSNAQQGHRNHVKISWPELRDNCPPDRQQRELIGRGHWRPDQREGHRRQPERRDDVGHRGNQREEHRRQPERRDEIGHRGDQRFDHLHQRDPRDDLLSGDRQVSRGYRDQGRPKHRPRKRFFRELS